MKLKKLSSVFLSVIMLMAFTVPFNTVSAAPLNLAKISVTAKTTDYTATTSSGRGDVYMTLTLTSSSATAVDVESISVGGSFDGSYTTKTTISANSSATVYFPIEFINSSRTASANIILKSGTDERTFTQTIAEVIPYSNLGGGGGGGSNTGDTPSEAVDPKPYVFSMDTTVFKAGDIVPVAMKLSTMDGYADDVRMKLSGPEGAEEMFSFYTQTGWLTVGNMTDMINTTPYVRINPSVADGTYAITVTFDYVRGGKTSQNTSKLNFIVKGKSTEVPYLKAANFAKAEIGKDNKSSLDVNVANDSSGDFKSVSISFNAAGSKGFSLSDTTRNIALNTISAHSTKKATFPIYVDTSVASGNYPIAFDISYKDGSGAIITAVETIYVQVNRSAEADGKKSTPRIIISKYSADTETINAGQSFTLDFSLQNTSSTTPVNNVKVVLGSAVTTGTGQNSTGGAVFFPAQGSNSFFIQSIGSGAEATNTIKLMARQDVEPGVYPVLLKLDFEDSSGNPFSSEEQISFSVTQEQRLDIQAMTVPTDSMMGSPIPVNFQYINKGKSTIFNLSVTVDGDFTLEGGSQYIGNLTAGYNDYFDNIILASKEGALKGNIVLKFEGSNGEEQEKLIPITCNVAAANMGGGDIGVPGMNPGVEPMPEGEKGGGLMSKLLWIGIPSLVVIVGVLALVIILKKRKAKKELVEDEED